jgi:hypothetical protein
VYEKFDTFYRKMSMFLKNLFYAGNFFSHGTSDSIPKLLIGTVEEGDLEHRNVRPTVEFHAIYVLRRVRGKEIRSRSKWHHVLDEVR